MGRTELGLDQLCSRRCVFLTCTRGEDSRALGFDAAPYHRSRNLSHIRVCWRVWRDPLFLYPLGHNTEIFEKKSKKTGLLHSVRQTSMQRMLRFYDQRFAQNSDFLFYLFNQEMRHEASREAGRIKSSANIQRLGKLINEPGFKKRLQYANDHPESDQFEEAVRFTRATTNGRVPT